jgi:hypothetical protein
MTRLVVAVTALSLAAFGQIQSVGPVPVTRTNGFRGSMGFGPAPPLGRPVTGSPYSAEEVSETVQTLADGTHVTQTTPVIHKYRDSEGRTRTERPALMMPRADVDSPVVAIILDPVEGVQYVLDPENKVAHRQTLRQSQGVAGVGGGRSGAGVGATTPGMVGGGTGRALTISQVQQTGPNGSSARMPQPERSHEDLGKQMIEGVMAEGNRTTMTWPVGSQGNDRPLVSVSENWFSQELGLVILNKSTDPRSGEHTLKTQNISRSEPDAMLFRVPGDYKIVDEEGQFQVQWGR